jgi:hypothetical protein
VALGKATVVCNQHDAKIGGGGCRIGDPCDLGIAYGMG